MKKFKKNGTYRSLGINGLGRTLWKCVGRSERASGLTLVKFESRVGFSQSGRVKVIDGIETILCSNVFDGRIVAAVPQK